MGGYHLQVAVNGGRERGEAARDHRAVSCMSPRSTPGRRRIKSYAIRKEDFGHRVYEQEEDLTVDVVEPALRYKCIGAAAISAQRRILPRIASRATGGRSRLQIAVFL